MKKFSLSAVALSICLFVFAADINDKVRGAFEQTFKNAKDVKWFENAGVFEVSFRQSDIDSRVVYDAEGNILRSVRYYGESTLPLFLRLEIQKQFSDKKVYGVTEVVNSEGTKYHIVLEDSKKWFHVEADAYGNVSVDKKFRKA